MLPLCFNPLSSRPSISQDDENDASADERTVSIRFHRGLPFHNGFCFPAKRTISVSIRFHRGLPFHSPTSTTKAEPSTVSIRFHRGLPFHWVRWRLALIAAEFQSAFIAAFHFTKSGTRSKGEYRFN